MKRDRPDGLKAYHERRARLAAVRAAARAKGIGYLKSGSFKLGMCGLCAASLWTPAAIIERPGKLNLVVHLRCKRKWLEMTNRKILEAA